MKQKNVNHLLLWFVKLTGVPLALLFFKPKIYYVDKKVQSRRLPKSCILMSNHKSLMDFVLYLCLFFGKTIRFLMAEVLFNKGKLFASFLFGIGGIYVNRDNYDFSFMYETIKVLDKGGIVGIFPQGRLPVGDKEWPFKPSVTYIALNSDAPIVPVYTDGNYGLFKRAKVVIGTPIDIHEFCTQKNPNEAEIKRLTEMLQSKVYELKEFLDTNA
ncbi:MAG: 1-acyl-sn-glycerol-3-phosphate acyltransferase [Ruminococcaceae bacterium]|nr:1-acyl-sn-glycerol-3-phosphate acyltransferase [Oscillospiraceae bacterium]